MTRQQDFIRGESYFQMNQKNESESEIEFEFIVHKFEFIVHCSKSDFKKDKCNMSLSLLIHYEKFQGKISATG